MDHQKIAAAKATVMGWFANASWAEKEPFLYSLFYTKVDVSKSQEETFGKMIRVFRKLPEEKGPGNKCNVGESAGLKDGEDSVGPKITSSREGSERVDRDDDVGGVGGRVIEAAGGELKIKIKARKMEGSDQGEEENNRKRRKIKWTAEDDEDKEKLADLNKKCLDVGKSKILKSLDEIVDEEVSGGGGSGTFAFRSPRKVGGGGGGIYWNKSEIVQAHREEDGLKQNERFMSKDVPIIRMEVSQSEDDNAIAQQQMKGSQENVFLSSGSKGIDFDGKDTVAAVGRQINNKIRNLTRNTSASGTAGGGMMLKKNPFLISKK